MAVRLAHLLTLPTTYTSGLPAITPCPALTGTAETDVAIIGAGYAGLSCATSLRQAGINCTVLEADFAGSKASGRNGGQMIPGFSLPQSDMRALYGNAAAHTLWKAVEKKRHQLIALAAAAPDRCELRDGIAYAALTEKQMASAHAQREDLLRHHGYEHLRIISKKEAQESMSPRFIGAIEWSDAKHLNPARYAALLRQHAIDAGVQLYENSALLRLEKQDNGYRLYTAAGCLRAREVVLCTGAGAARPLGLSSEIAPSRHTPIATFMLATEVCRAERILPSTAAISDMRNAMSYFRRTADNRILYGGEIGLSFIHPGLMLRALEREMRRMLPGLQGVEVETAWAGLIDMTATLMPSICRLAPSLYQANGFSGHGLVLTALAGESIAGEIRAMRQNRHDPVFQALEKLQPPEIPENRTFAIIAQGWRWLPKLLEDKWSARVTL